MKGISLARFLAIVTLFVLVSLPPMCHADTANFALVRCNATTGAMDVREDFTENDVYEAPKGYQSKGLGTLVEYVSPPDGSPDDAVHGTYRRKIGDWRLSCTLMGVSYHVLISPWSEEDMVQAQCGPGDPDLEVTVFRNTKMLVKELRFGGGCLRPTPVFLAIELSEVKKTVILEEVFVSKPGKAITTDIDIPYGKMPSFDQRTLALR